MHHQCKDGQLAFVTTTKHPEKLGVCQKCYKKVHLVQLTTRRTNIRLTIFNKAIHGHLSLPVGNLLQPVQCHSWYLNSKAFNTIHTSKNCYNFSYFPRTIKDCNSLPDTITSITEPQQFKQALTHLVQTNMTK